MYKGWIYLAFWFVILSVKAQDFQLSVGNDSLYLVRNKIKLHHRDSVSLLHYLKKIRYTAINKGFILMSYDTVKWSKKGCYINPYLGPKIKKMVLTIEQDSFHFGDRINEKQIKNTLFTTSEISKLLLETETNLLNKGHPFVSIQLTHIQYEKDFVTGKIQINQGPYFKISEVYIKGDSAISEKSICNLIGIHEGDTFDESRLITITEKLRQAIFIKELKPHEILFTEKGCELYLYLASNPVSNANGTLGIQPNPVNQRVNIVGEANIKLLNTLRRGELIHLHWRSMQPQTQAMLLKANYPYLFKSSFGIDAQLQLYKKDSTFLELKSMLGIQYPLEKGGLLKAFYQLSSNDLLSAGVQAANVTNNADIRSNNYGLSFLKRTFDYLPNPGKGYVFSFEGSVGSRKTTLLKDSIALVNQNVTYRIGAGLEIFLPLSRRHIIRLATTNEFYYAPETYQNELFRFGGQLTLRGFNEDEIFASSRSVNTIEYRFLLDKNSNLFAFYDQGYYENNASKYFKDHPFGFGAGLSFGTDLGIFSLSYALGKQKGNPILLQNGKIHFGYIAYF